MKLVLYDIIGMIVSRHLILIQGTIQVLGFQKSFGIRFGRLHESLLGNSSPSPR